MAISPALKDLPHGTKHVEEELHILHVNAWPQTTS